MKKIQQQRKKELKHNKMSDESRTFFFVFSSEPIGISNVSFSILTDMKALITTVLIFTLFSSVFAKTIEDRTFLIIFDKEELKQYKSSPEYIELTFNRYFVTKTYSGNSEYALLVTIPNSNSDTCDIGQLLVDVNRKTTIQLQEIALRIIDLTETKSNYKALLASMESKPIKKKKDRGGITLQAN